MSWQDRIKDGIIETASGEKFVFEFRDMSNTREETTTIFKFPLVGGSYVQRLSSNTNRFPIVIYFSGQDCDITADAFEEATRDPRPLIFSHPLRRELIDVQLLDLQRNDNLATAANEISFQLTLYETIDIATPLSSENAPRLVDNERISLESINAENYKSAISEKTSTEISTLKNEMTSLIATIQTSLAAYEIATDALAELESILLTAENLIATVETNAESFAFVMQGLINFPSRALRRLQDKFYFFENFINDTSSLEDPDNMSISLSAGIVGYCQVALLGDEDYYLTKTNVYNEVDSILGYNSLYYEILDQIELSFPEFQQDNVSRETVSNIVAIVSKNLNDIAFSAKQERKLVLTKHEELYSLVYRLLGADSAGELDDSINVFLRANNILDSSMFELEPGREIIYYV